VTGIKHLENIDTVVYLLLCRFTALLTANSWTIGRIFHKLVAARSTYKQTVEMWHVSVNGIPTAQRKRLEIKFPSGKTQGI